MFTTEKNDQLQLALEFVRDTNQHLFLTGKAGTGKTTFLKQLKNECSKRMIIVAPTGVAALQAGGTTIHSFFQLPFGPHLPGQRNLPDKIHRFAKNKITLIRSLDLLVIDEISMVRADLMDAIDEVLRRFRNRSLPFGGVQLLMIGDLQQLAPVVKTEEWNLLAPYYDSCYFFGSQVLRKTGFLAVELQKVYRQQDEQFIGLLNRIRDNQLDQASLQQLNARYIPGFAPKQDSWITLTTHHYKADRLNHDKLSGLKSPLQIYSADSKGEFPDYLLPTDRELQLKEGAQVMFAQNDSMPQKRFYNGKIGRITTLGKEQIGVQCPGDPAPVILERSEWKNTRYRLNTASNELEEEVIGSFIQFPLRLAWAITIHKSQGLTFDRAIIDASESFAPGQVYVAISRCRTLDGLILSQPLNTALLHTDKQVSAFSRQLSLPTTTDLFRARKIYQLQLLNELFSFGELLFPINYLLKVVADSQSVFLGDILEKLQLVKAAVQLELEPTAVKFRQQLAQISQQQMLPDANSFLQERVQKAAHYFGQSFDQKVVSPVRDIKFRTDNSQLKKTVKSGLQQLNSLLLIESYGLKSCLDGFENEKLLRARSLALSEQLQAEDQDQNSESFSQHPELFRILNQWRILQAQKNHIAVSGVLAQKTLLAVADEIPATAGQLKVIKGMGGKKLQTYGKEILEQTIAYRRQHQLNVPPDADQEPLKAGMDSKTLSFYLFQQGKSVDEIVRERQMTLSTVEHHLAHFVGTGELDPQRLISAALFKQLVGTLTNYPQSSAGELKARLGNDFSYGAIQIGREYLNFKNHAGSH